MVNPSKNLVFGKFEFWRFEMFLLIGEMNFLSLSAIKVLLLLLGTRKAKYCREYGALRTTKKIDHEDLNLKFIGKTDWTASTTPSIQTTNHLRKHRSVKAKYLVRQRYTTPPFTR